VSLAILVDMNLSPDWVPFLQTHGHVAVHWSTVGDLQALDPELMGWASANGHIILTHDLDPGTILEQTHGTGPSVVLVRNQDTLPTAIGTAVADAIQECDADLHRSGALLVVDASRVLPI
jgi:predicted nuclease of predicted toxin-antitoxin system